MIKSVLAHIFIASSLLLVCSSCQKELSFTNPDPVETDKNLLGTWKFVSMEVTAVITDEISEEGQTLRSVTRTEYVTSNNKGSLLIEDGQMSSMEISFDVTTKIVTDFYLNDILIETEESPFSFSMPASSNTGAYEQIGSDSLYFPNGSVIGLGIAGNDPATANGARYWFENGQLIIASTVEQTEIDDSAGIVQTSVARATSAIRLERE